MREFTDLLTRCRASLRRTHGDRGCEDKITGETVITNLGNFISETDFKNLQIKWGKNLDKEVTPGDQELDVPILENVFGVDELMNYQLPGHIQNYQ